MVGDLVEAGMVKTARRSTERSRISWCYFGNLSVYRDMEPCEVRFVSEAVGDPTLLDTLDVDCGHGWLAGAVVGLSDILSVLVEVF